MSTEVADCLQDKVNESGQKKWALGCSSSSSASSKGLDKGETIQYRLSVGNGPCQIHTASFLGCTGRHRGQWLTVADGYLT